MSSVATGADGEVTDGRLLRGQRTRALIVQSLLDLVSEGVESPTAALIAERAGVSVRSVFQHFVDLEALYRDLVLEQTERVAPLVAALDGGGSLEERLDAAVLQRARLFEAIRPVRAAIAARVRTSVVLAERVDHLSAALREQIADHFGPELAAGGPELLDAVDLWCSFETWDRLRGVQALEPAEASAVLRTGLGSLLGPRSTR